MTKNITRTLGVGVGNQIPNRSMRPICTYPSGIQATNTAKPVPTGTPITLFELLNQYQCMNRQSYSDCKRYTKPVGMFSSETAI